jgi:hypothetical protein
MFENKVWYHGITRKAIIAFGVMFNNINIRRRNAADQITQTIRVPLSYAPKNKMLSRILAQPDPDKMEKEVLVPRLSFELIAFEYDAARKINLHNQQRAILNETQAKRVYGPTPYNLTVNLYAYAKNQDDGLQILEQIIPAFNPDFNVTVTYVPELGIKHDLPIILNSISYDDQYEGAVQDHRVIIWTYTFTLKLYYYGPVETQEVIRRAIVDIFNNEDLTSRIDKYTVSTDPADALPTDTDFRFIETFDDSNFNLG